MSKCVGCWDQPAITWCDECRAVVQLEANRAIKMVEEIEDTPSMFDESARAAGELMRWILRDRQMRTELLSYRLQELERESDELLLCYNKLQYEVEAVSSPVLEWHADGENLICAPDHPWAKPKLRVRRWEEGKVTSSMDALFEDGVKSVFDVAVRQTSFTDNLMEEGKQIASAMYWSWLRSKGPGGGYYEKG